MNDEEHMTHEFGIGDRIVRIGQFRIFEVMSVSDAAGTYYIKDISKDKPVYLALEIGYGEREYVKVERSGEHERGEDKDET